MGPGPECDVRPYISWRWNVWGPMVASRLTTRTTQGRVSGAAAVPGVAGSGVAPRRTMCR